MSYTIRSKTFKSMYAHPTPSIGKGASTLETSANFATEEIARAWANQNRQYITQQLGAGAEIVKVIREESVSESVVQLIAGQSILSTDKFVLERDSLGGVFAIYLYAHAAFPSFTNTVSDARRFDTVRAAMAHAKSIKDDVWVSILRRTTKTRYVESHVVGPVFASFAKFEIGDSSVISRIEYDHVAGVAQLSFKSRGRKFSTDGVSSESSVYEYSNVDAKDVFALLSAPSKGTHIASVWKPKYDKSARKVG